MVRFSLRYCLGALTASLAAGAISLLVLTTGLRWLGPAALEGPLGEGGWTNRSRGWLVSTGFYPPEGDAGTGRQFSWTGRSASVAIPHLNRSREHVFTIQISAGRPDPSVGFPLLLLSVDGVLQATHETSNDSEAVTVTVPRRPRDGATIGLTVSDTFVPGPTDPRALGVVVDGLRLAAVEGPVRPSRHVAIWTAVAIATAVFGVLLCGWPWRPGLLAASAVTLALLWLQLQDAAFLGTFVSRLTWIGAGGALGGAIVGAVRTGWRRASAWPEWGVAAGLTLAVLLIKLALVAHPLMNVGDGIFQVHRSQLVQAGQYFFTSITPRPFFEFPYAIGLYVAALPFSSYFPTQLDHLRLLRGLVLLADAAVGFALYAVARRYWGQAVPALWCAALWPFARAPLQALSNANLTNAFGQGLFGIAMAGLAWNAATKPRSHVVTLGTFAALTAAFLSHFSTLSLGVPIAGAVGVGLMVGGRGDGRRAGRLTVLIVLAALAVSYAVYYSQFHEVYAKTLARVAVQEHDQAAGSTMAASPSVKLRRWASESSDDYGLPGWWLLAVATAGAVGLVGRRPREGLTITLIVWAGVWVACTALGLLTAVQMRANLAAAPVFVALGAYALGALTARASTFRILAGLLGALIAWEGVRLWVRCLWV